MKTIILLIIFYSMGCGWIATSKIEASSPNYCEPLNVEGAEIQKCILEGNVCFLSSKGGLACP